MRINYTLSDTDSVEELITDPILYKYNRVGVHSKFELSSNELARMILAVNHDAWLVIDIHNPARFSDKEFSREVMDALQRRSKNTVVFNMLVNGPTDSNYLPKIDGMSMAGMLGLQYGVVAEIDKGIVDDICLFSIWIRDLDIACMGTRLLVGKKYDELSKEDKNKFIGFIGSEKYMNKVIR